MERVLSIDNLTSSQILCSNIYFFENFAKCQIRDDISPNLQDIFMLLFCINLILLGKNVLNLILIKKLEKIRKVKHMKIFNIWLFPTILLQLLLFATSFLENVGIGGYPLILYQIFSNSQVLGLNSLLALGGYLWLEMIFQMSFNNKKMIFVKRYFVLSCIFNLLIFLYASLVPIITNLQDTTWWPDFEPQQKITYIFVTISTLINGIFFSVGGFYASHFSKSYRNFEVSNKKLICDLSLLAGIFSLMRILQDFIQSFFPLISELKEKSVAINGWGYPIYLFFFVIISNVIPIFIFLVRYTPTIEKSEYTDNSHTEPSDFDDRPGTRRLI